MPLELTYIINEGIQVSEKIISKDTGETFQETIEVIIRDINLFPEGVKVDFEFLDLNGYSELKSLSEDERYDVTPLCTLHLPKDPLRGRNSRVTLRRSLPRYPRIIKRSKREDKVFLKFYAPEAVEFSKKRMYD